MIASDTVRGQQQGRGASSALRYGLWALLAVAILLFLARGCWRALQDSGDLATQYAATRAWLEGKNPYDNPLIARLFQEHGGPSNIGPSEESTPSVYPPITFVPLAPLALLPWGLAKAALCVLNVAAVALTVRGLLRHFGKEWTPEQRLALAALAFGLAPVHTGLSKGQTVAIAFALMVWAWILVREGKPWLSGLLCGLAICLKTQLFIVFPLIYLMRRDWKAFGATVATVGGIGIVSLLGLLRGGIDWLPAWRLNLQSPYAAYGAANPLRHHMLNSQILLNWLLGEGVPWNLIVVALIGACLLWLLLRHRRRGVSGDVNGPEATREETAVLALLLLLDLLALYHRFYDATVLLIFAMVLFDWQRRGRRREALIGWLCIAMFFVPGAVLLQQFLDSGRIPRAAFGSESILILALCHQIITLIVATVLLLVTLARDSATPAPLTNGYDDQANSG